MEKESSARFPGTHASRRILRFFGVTATAGRGRSVANGVPGMRNIPRSAGVCEGRGLPAVSSGPLPGEIARGDMSVCRKCCCSLRGVTRSGASLTLSRFAAVSPLKLRRKRAEHGGKGMKRKGTGIVGRPTTRVLALRTPRLGSEVTIVCSGRMPTTS